MPLVPPIPLTGPNPAEHSPNILTQLIPRLQILVYFSHTAHLQALPIPRQLNNPLPPHLGCDHTNSAVVGARPEAATPFRL